VQSKVRILVTGIDEGQTGIDVARPYNDSFERYHRCRTEEQVEEVKKGSLDYMISSSEAPEALTPEETIMYTTTFYIGLTLPLERSTLDISYPAEQFKGKVIDSNLFNSDTMSIRVVHTRNTGLPDDVFVPGESRPTKPKKAAKAGKSTEEKKKKKSKDSAKRPFNETGLDDSEHQAAKRRQSDLATNGVVATPTAA